MTQFAFLAADFPDLHALARRAEAAALSDPRGACFHARLALETALKWLYRADPALRPPYEDTLAALILSRASSTSLARRSSRTSLLKCRGDLTADVLGRSLERIVAQMRVAGRGGRFTMSEQGADHRKRHATLGAPSGRRRGWRGCVCMNLRHSFASVGAAGARELRSVAAGANGLEYGQEVRVSAGARSRGPARTGARRREPACDRRRQGRRAPGEPQGEAKRERFLSQKELAQLGMALNAAERGEVLTDKGAPISPYAIAALRLLIFTGARRGEILSLRWEPAPFPVDFKNVRKGVHQGETN